MVEHSPDEQNDLEIELIGIRGDDEELLDRLSLAKRTASELRQSVRLREIEGEYRPYIQLDDPDSNETLGEIQFTNKDNKIRTDVRVRDPNIPRFERAFHDHSKEIQTSGAAALYRFNQNLVSDPFHDPEPSESASGEIICPNCDERNYRYGTPIKYDLKCDHCGSSLYDFKLPEAGDDDG